MLKFLARRVLWTIPVVFVILVLIFTLMHIMPGSPWEGDAPAPTAMSFGMDDITRRALERRYGLDDPLWKQFISYLVGRTDPVTDEYICGLICGNLGPSFRQRGRTVQDILFDIPKGKTFFESRFGYSLRLGLYAFVLCVGVGIPLGVVAALKQGSWVDTIIRSFATLAISLPNFVLGLLLIVLLSGMDLISISPRTWSDFNLKVWGLPILILGISVMAAFIRLTRASILDVMRKDYIRTARAKGAKEWRVVNLHMLRNALIPLITFSAPALLELLTGTFVIESMFGYPGMGSEFVQAVPRRDYSMIMGITLIYAFLITGANTLIDMFYGYLDPRIRVE